MSEYIEGLMFGDFSALESEERAKIDHVLRDGSNAVELYWSAQDNGLHVSALTNGPSSLSAEERERIEQQKLQDIASSLQNLQNLNASATVSTLHSSNTELSLVPENNFVFRADTPPVNKEVPNTGHRVPEHVSQIVNENSSGISFVGNSREQSPFNGGGQYRHGIEDKVQEYGGSPQNTNYAIPQPRETQLCQSSYNQVGVSHSSAKQVQAANECITNRQIDSEMPSAANGSSQKVEKRRNKKKRPPNYYENREREVTSNDISGFRNAPNDVSGFINTPDYRVGVGGGSQIHNNVNNIPPPVNMLPHQNLSQHVPLQNVPPEIVAQMYANQQQQYVQFVSNCLASAQMDPQFAQQQHQQQHHQQQQMAIATLNALLQQGVMQVPMQVPPPHMMPHLIGQMPPGQVPMPPDTRVPPPNIETPIDEGPSRYPQSIPQMDHSHHKRHSVERQFPQNHHASEFIGNNKQPDSVRFMNYRENKSYVRESARSNQGQEIQVRSSPPKQMLPPSNNVKSEPVPNVPKRTEQQETFTQNTMRREDRDFEAQKQLQESIEKVTQEYQELQKNESIRKLKESKETEVSPRTEECDKNVAAEKVFKESSDESEQVRELLENSDSNNLGLEKKLDPESSQKPANDEPESLAVEKSVELSEDHVQDIQKVTTEPTDNVPSDGEIKIAGEAETAGEPQKDTECETDAASPPETGPNSTKPASVWGPKPAGAWAALFKNEKTKGVVVYPDNKQVNSSESTAKSVETKGTDKVSVPPKPVTAAEDKAAKQLGDILLKHEVNHRPQPLQPRGLVNRSNWCYVNATLQALLACPPFYHLMKALPSFPPLSRGPTSTPVIDSLIEFVSEFGPMQPRNDKNDSKGKQSAKLSSKDIQPGSPFEPIKVYKMLHLVKHDAEFKHGRQEDAEEFLTCVLNGLHDEMVAAINLVTGEDSESKANGGFEVPDEGEDSESKANGGFEVPDEGEEEDAEDDEQWEKVGPKNKSVITRSAKISESPIAKIFGGQLRSILHQQGSKESATLEPFFTLQLDVHNQNVWDVKDALDCLVSKESLQGYTCAKTKMEVEATRRILLEELPPVLILHLKWFIYNKSGGLQKHPKNFGFEERLELSKDLLSQKARAKYHANQRTYKLFAVVNHHGARAIGGHYTTYVYHPGIPGWIHQDDSNIKTVNLSQVLKLEHPRVPYLLYYRRVDVSS